MGSSEESEEGSPSNTRIFEESNSGGKKPRNDAKI